MPAYSKAALQPMSLPPVLDAALELLRQAGAKPFIVGGAVRDHMLGLKPKDLDVEVFQIPLEAIASAIAPLGKVNLVGESFGVAKVWLDGVEYDFAVPRTEVKSGPGHRGFEVMPDPHLTIAAAAARRDFTLNAIYYDPADQTFDDPWHGIADLHAGVLRHTSPAFAEDPLRVLRAFQFASRFDFTVAPETVALARQLQPEFATITAERVWGEWDKWATKSKAPEKGLQFLADAGWLQFFPELANLQGVKQNPEYHPEGDAWVHTLHCLKALRRGEVPQRPEDRRTLHLAVLCHDMGKATCSQVQPSGKLTSYGHEAAGGPLAAAFLRRMRAPLDVIREVVPLVENHMLHANEISARAVRRAARRLQPATLQQLCVVMEADMRGRPPIADICPQAVKDTLALAAECQVMAAGPAPLIQGRHLKAAGLVPGPQFRDILEMAMEAQLEGTITTEQEGLDYLVKQQLLPERNPLARELH